METREHSNSIGDAASGRRSDGECMHGGATRPTHERHQRLRIRRRGATCEMETGSVRFVQNIAAVAACAGGPDRDRRTRWKLPRHLHSPVACRLVRVAPCEPSAAAPRGTAPRYDNPIMPHVSLRGKLLSVGVAIRANHECAAGREARQRPKHAERERETAPYQFALRRADGTATCAPAARRASGGRRELRWTGGRRGYNDRAATEHAAG